ncbi:putative protein with domain of unknown function (DUF1996) [Lyophyllum shimeji]|uniref:DUF1996 domain-containing protein n=1 Tax=Lyophyllum shimeji TaxID=47721 RepID=A0A9P3PWD0_LYOSH|nr:putative protein with domain of unknown function (DUF1996) [Lyophyllum shimeji]
MYSLNHLTFYLLVSSILQADPSRAYWLMGANNILTTQRLAPWCTLARFRRMFTQCSVEATLDSTSRQRIYVGASALQYLSPVDMAAALVFPMAERNIYQRERERNNMYADRCEKPGYTTPFPDNFRMVSGDPNLRTLNPSSFAQQAITFLCLDFGGTSRKFNELPNGRCPSGVRAQINFPSCWDGENVDSLDHKSHVAFLSTGPDNGTCRDPRFPVTIPRIFIEVYWNTQVFDKFRHEAMTPSQPFVFSNGDPTGYGYHADFINGWEPDVLQRAVNECNCNPYGDPTCCAGKGIFTINQHTNCYITNTVDEATTGTLATLPGNNPVQAGCYEDYVDTNTPAILSPVFVYNGTGSLPPPTGSVVIAATSTKLVQTPRGTSNSTHEASIAMWPRRTALSKLLAASSVAGGSSLNETKNVNL